MDAPSATFRVNLGISEHNHFIVAVLDALMSRILAAISE